MSAYRDSFDVCPACGARLDVAVPGLRQCSSCHGAWVEAGTLEAMWREMSPKRPLVFRPRTTGRHERPCVLCGRPMARELAPNDVPVDRCFGHGVWFDADELPTALAGAALSTEDFQSLFGELVRKMT